MGVDMFNGNTTHVTFYFTILPAVHLVAFKIGLNQIDSVCCEIKSGIKSSFVILIFFHFYCNSRMTKIRRITPIMDLKHFEFGCNYDVLMDTGMET